MSRLTRDGTAEPVSRDQILRHARGQGNIHFPCSADHEQDWQPCPVDPYSAICDDHTPPTKTSQPSGVSPDSHKRVRHPDVTMSKRAIARKSAARAVTMPDNEAQKIPVKRNSSVKTEVKLSL